MPLLIIRQIERIAIANRKRSLFFFLTKEETEKENIENADAGSGDMGNSSGQETVPPEPIPVDNSSA